MAKLGANQFDLLLCMRGGTPVKYYYGMLRLMQDDGKLDHWLTMHHRKTPFQGLIDRGYVAQVGATNDYVLTDKGREATTPPPPPKTTKEELKEVAAELFRLLYHSDECETEQDNGDCSHDKLLLKLKELAARL